MGTEMFGTPELDPPEYVDPDEMEADIRARGGRMAFRPADGEGEEGLIQPLFVRVIDQIGTGELVRLQVDTLGGEMVSSVVMKPGDLRELLDEAVS